MSKRRPGESLLKFWKRRKLRREMLQSEEGRGLQLEALERREFLDAAGLLQNSPFALLSDLPAGPAGAEPVVKPTQFRAMSWDRNEFQQLLAGAPKEFTPSANSPLRIQLPTPTGEQVEFDIVRTAIMAPEMEAKYPDFRTYAGKGVDDPAASLRLEVTPFGLYAQVMSPELSFKIDPAYIGDDDTLLVYRSGDVPVDPRKNLIQTGDDSPDHDHAGAAGEGSDSGLVLPSSGTTLRVYRAAIAATAEYTAYHGGTVAAGWNAVMVAVDRLNQLFENEMSVRLQLINNNDQLIFTDPNTDGYTNGDAFAMLGENQPIVDRIIGNSNYDIGHVFGTLPASFLGGFVGFGSIASVGIDSRKGMGSSALWDPVGDGFVIDLVAHEMGHQFGANHTYSNCGGQQGNTGTQVEPGSGSTIMSYGGACGPENIVNSKSAYYHVASLAEMLEHVDVTIPNVGTRLPTGNAVPTIDAGADYVIPARTPFELAATGADSDASDTLTYTWEEMDTGPLRSISAADNGQSPLVRSWDPTPSPTRVIPRLQELLNNTVPLGEMLPTVARDMDFTVTVRDNHTGGGAVASDDMVARVVNTGAPFRVTSPNTNVRWPAYTEQTVTWDVAGTTGNGINASAVNILLSTDGGLTYPNVLASRTPNDGSQKITVPELLTSQARIRVQAAGNIFFDISNVNFTISEPLVAPELISVGYREGDILDPAGPNLLDASPKELTFRFTGGQTIVGSTLPTGVRIVRAGGDGDFSNGVVVVQPGFLGLSDTANSVVIARFAEPLPQDLYRIEVFAQDLPADGITTTSITGIRNSDGVLLLSSGAADREELFFDLRLGAQVISVVPQPVAHVSGALQQATDSIEVYFNDKDLGGANSNSPVRQSTFYRLVDTKDTLTEGDDTLRLPQSVTYNATTNSVTLKFAAPIPVGTYRLHVGESDEPNGTIATAMDIGSLFDTTTYTGLSYLGDDDGTNVHATDVDYFAFRLVNGQSVTVAVAPQDGLNANLQLYRRAGGTPVAVGGVVDALGADGLESIVVNATADDVYYVAVAGSAATVGAYRLSLAGQAGRPLPLANDDNSSLATASDLGVLGGAAQTISAQIEPQNNLFLLPNSPGGNDEPGHRHIPVEDHLDEFGPTLGLSGDVNGIEHYWYSFPQSYGVDPQNVPLLNEITDAQKQRAREAIELWSRYLGIRFSETADCNTLVTTDPCISIATGDLRAVDELLPPGQGGPPGVYGNGLVVVNGSNNWGQSEYGGAWFTTALHEIGHAIGLEHAYDLQAVMGAGITGEPVYPGDQDIVHGQRLFQLDANDVDLYKFSVPQAGWFTAETTAERLPNASSLDSALRLYIERTGLQFLSGGTTIADGDWIEITDGSVTNRFEFDNETPGSVGAAAVPVVRVPFTASMGVAELANMFAGVLNDKKVTTVAVHGSNAGGAVQLDNRVTTTLSPGLAAKLRVFAYGELVAQNDNYNGLDAAIGVHLEPGSYYLGVSSTGNMDYDPGLSNSGSSGRSEGPYQLKVNLVPASASAIQDTTVDGNGAPAPIRLDGDADGVPGGGFDFWFRSAPTRFVDKSNDRTLAIEGNGSLANPWDNIASALAQAQPGDIVRVVGNGGTDGSLQTPADAKPYLVGLNNANQTLSDGADIKVPQNVTLMIDAGALIKLQKANIDAGTSSQGVGRQGGAIQVLGTPQAAVTFRSFRNDAFGGNSDGVSSGANPGDWGGIVLRDDSDREAAGVYLNWINNADIGEGGGKVLSDGTEQVFSAIHLDQSRPTISQVTITRSADAAVSADPDSFDDSLGRIGPDIHGVHLSQNSVNGLFIRVQTELGSGVDQLDGFARWDDSDIVHVLTDKLVITGNPGGPLENQARTDSRLRIDPGVVVKLQNARIQAEWGAQLIAEGTIDHPVIFTSVKDDQFGAGGVFDTKSDGTVDAPAAGDWAGLVFAPTSHGSLDRVWLEFAGGSSPIDGTVATFNPVEIHQADVRVANSLIANSSGGTANVPSRRDGLPANSSAVIFVRGTEAVIVDNIIRDNSAAGLPAISIDANSLNGQAINDPGRSTGLLMPGTEVANNHGVLVRGNRLGDNGINGMLVRGGTLTTEGVWDDTDIVHVVSSEIIVPNKHTFGGLRLESSPSSSLVVKFSGATAGFTASGTPLDINDRIGGSVEIIGQPNYPVVLTSLADNSVGAGFTPSGVPQFVTWTGTNPPASAGDWRGLKLEKYSNDRNVARVLTREASLTGGVDLNGTPTSAEYLGVLAPDEKSGDDVRRLGFLVTGSIATDSAADVDVYSFTGTAGTEVWIDIDRTAATLDSMLELVDANGNVLARSFDNTPALGHTGPSPVAFPLIRDSLDGKDWYSTNPRDAGLRVVLPGTGSNTYFVRVRSQTVAGNEENVAGGQSQGEYQLQIRLRQADETPGSTLQLSDLRYATTGIDVEGLPGHSPLTGETGEVAGNNDSSGGAQYVGNLLTTDRNTLSIAGSLGSADDVDWYRFTLDYDLVQSVNGVNNGAKTFATVFDLDYADGISRADTVLSVFDSGGRLIFVSRDSDIEDDQPKPGEGSDVDDLSRGSVGKLDPYLGTVQLPAGNIPAGASRTYYVAVSSNRLLPTVMGAYLNTAGGDIAVRLEPVDSVRRVVEDHIGFTGFTSGTIGANGMTTPVSPQSGPLFDLQNATELSAHVVPFTLADVQLYVTTNGQMRSINPFNGQTNYLGNGSLAGFNTQDIVMRSDGLLFGADSDTVNTAGVAGGFTTFDLGQLTEVSSTGVAIPDYNASTNPEVLGELTSNVIDALTFPRDRSNVFYSVRGAHRPGGQTIGGGTSTLYFDNNGSGAANASGRRGEIIGSGVSGVTTGLAFDRFGTQLYGVNDAGQFYRLSQFTGSINRLIADFSPQMQPGESFSGLALGPQNLENGRYRDLLFATTNRGRIFALDPNQNGGTPTLPVFDTNNDRVADSTVLATGVFGLTGLAFSPLDFNLWHPTMIRGTNAGHGVTTAPDSSRNPGTVTQLVGPNGNRQLQTEAAGGLSFYFGLEDTNNPPVNQPPPVAYAPGQGQYGVLSATYQFDLTAGVIGNNYNLPGGALGKLQTNSFSLEGYTRTDKPTLYFNYLLQTEVAGGSNSGAFRDSARVFVSKDDGATWELLATNNPLRSTGTLANAELPTFATTSRDGWASNPNQQVQELFHGDAWRQARIDLADYAGEENLRLRFDFSTAGEMGDPTITGISENSGVGLNSRLRGENNAFEGFYVDDILVGFAERGEMVTNAPGDSTGMTAMPGRNASAPQEILTGPYQLEIRRGTEIVTSKEGVYGEPILPTAQDIAITQQFDTNDRLVSGRSFVAPDGASIIDGQQFTVSDGVRMRTFEFDRPSSPGLVNPNAIGIAIVGTENVGQVANAVAAAVNSVPGWSVKAITKPAAVNSPIVDLVGATLIDFSSGNATAELQIVSGAASVTESGLNNATTATITRSGDLSAPLTVVVRGVNPATGLPHSDEIKLRDPAAPLVIANPLTVTIPPGIASVTLDVLGQADLVADGTQPVQLIATAPGYTSISDTVDVVDVEIAQLNLVINAASISEIGGATTGTVTRNTPTDVDQVVQLLVHLTRNDAGQLPPNNNSAADQELIVPLTVTIPATQTQVTFPIQAFDDSRFDGDQTVRVTAYADGFVSSTASLQVLDAGDLQITLASNQVNEPGAPAGTFTTATITRSGSTANPLNVSIAATDVQSGATTNEVTLTDPLTAAVANPLSVTIPANASSVTIRIDSVADNTPDGDQFVDLTVTAGASSARTTLEVVDQDTRSLSLSIHNSRVSEAFSAANGGIPATWVRVSRTGGTDQPVTVTFDPTPSDVTVSTPTVVIPAGRTFVDVAVVTNNDANPSPPDSDPAPVTITARVNATTFASATLNVDDNENNYIITTTPGQVIEGNDNTSRGLGSLEVRRPFTGDGFTVTVNGAPSGHIRLPAGDAAQPDTENISFAGGQTARTISLDTIPNTINDHERQVTLAVTGGASADVWVADDEDPSLSILLNSLEITESGGQMTVIVQRPNIPALLSSPLQIQVQVNDPDRGNAASDEAAIIASNGQLRNSTLFIIQANQPSVSFVVQGLPDGLVDADYDLSGDGTRQRVSLTASVLATAPQRYNRAIANFDVRDVDTPQATLAFFDRLGNQVNAISEHDGIRAATGRISVNNLEGRATRAEWGDPNSLPITFDLTATNLADEINLYGGDPAVATRVHLPSGATSVDFDVDAIDDLILDGDQTAGFSVTSSDSRFGPLGGSLLVRDYVPAPRRLILDVAQTSISEGNASTLTVTRTGDVSNGLTVTLTAPGDVTVTPNVVTFLPGSSVTTVANVTVAAIVDGIADGTRTAILDVDRTDPALNGYEIETDSIDVTDQDVRALSVTITGVTRFTEDSGRAVTRGFVTRNSSTTDDLVVTLVLTDSTEARVLTTLTIPSGDFSAPFEIDAVDELRTDGSHILRVIATAEKHLSGGAAFRVDSVDNAREYQRLGDRNLDRDQGQLVISSNMIRDVEQFGVQLAAGSRDANNSLAFPGVVRNLPTLNSQRLSPGPVLVNNVFANSGSAAVSLSGDTLTNPSGAVPFARILNNTFYGGSNPSGTAILVANEASPTILNNIFSQVGSAVTTSNNGTSQVVINANLFHGVNTQGTDAIGLTASTPLFVDASQLNFYLVPGSLGIDSSRNSLADRTSFINVKSPLGIPASPIVAPSRDIYGQLRVDDSSQNQSFGFGADVFKDRGAVDRADNLGPFAVLANPVDNDSLGRDLDPNDTVVQLRSGNLSAFQLTLQDGRGELLPSEGTGLNASTVNGNSVFVTENGVPLVEGVDFTLGFNPSSGEVLITPTSGIWRPSSAYVIVLNNRDRYLLTAPSVTRVVDGNVVTITDSSGGTAVFEYESGYRLAVGETISLTVPAAGGGVGGIADGQTFSVTRGVQRVTFEFDSNGNSVIGNTRISYLATDTAATLAAKIVTALQNANVGLSPSLIVGQPGKIHLGADSSHIVDPGTSLLELAGTSDAVNDGDTIRVQYSGGTTPVDVTFEIDLDGNFTVGNTPIAFVTPPKSQDVVTALVAALQAPSLNLPNVKDVGNLTIQIGGTTSHSITLGSSNTMRLSGLPGVTPSLRFEVPGTGAGGVSDGQQFQVSNGTQTLVFEFNSIGSVANGAIPVAISSFSTSTVVANAMRSVLLSSGLGVNPTVATVGSKTYLVLGEPSGALSYSLSAGTSGLVATGVSNGAIPIPFEPTAAYTPQQFAGLLAAAIKGSSLVGVMPTVRGGGQLFLDGAASITGITATTIQAIRDLAGNPLRANQPAPGAETMFTILTPGVTLDFGDGPDNSTALAGGFATVLDNNGARHAILSRNRLYFGKTNADLDGELDANPGAAANSDGADEILGTSAAPSNGITVTRVWTPDVSATQPYRTPIEINASAAGFVDAWVDFNRDGIWDDATERILSSAPVQAGANTLLAAATPAGIIPVNQLSITAAARFRISTSGGVLPSGLAVNGEVEDHVLTIIANSAPVLTSAVPLANLSIPEDKPTGTVVPLGGAFTDVDLSNGLGDQLTLSVVGNTNPNLIQVALGDTNPNNQIVNDSLIATAAPDLHGTAVITVRATDHADRFVETSFTITVRPVNDPPVVTAVATLAAVEDTTRNVGGILITDKDILEFDPLPNPTTGSMTVTFSATNGRLTLRTNVFNGITASQVTNNGTGAVTVTAPLAAISQTLLQADGLSYLPGTNYNGADAIVIAPNDLGNFGEVDPLAASPNRTIAVTVSAVNDQPTITAPNVVDVDEDAPLGLDLTGLSVQDVDVLEGTGAARVTLTTTNGRLKLFQTTGITFSSGADNSSAMTLDGQLSAINAALTGSVFLPNANFNGVATLAVSASDLGNFPGPAKTANGTFVINVRSVNDAPAFTPLGGNQAVNEDSGRRTVPGFVTNISSGPTDEAGQLLNFRVTLANRQGTLEFVNDVPTIDASTGSLIFEPKANTNGSVVVQVRLEDNGTTANGGVNTFPTPPADPFTFTITVNAVNDAPEFTKGGNETIPEDVGLRSVPWATAIRPSPSSALDEQTQTVAFNITPAQQFTGNLAFSVPPAIDPTTGVLTYRTAPHTNGQGIFRVTLRDNGDGTAPNSNTSAAQTLTITVTPVNDAPEFTLAGSPTVDEDSGPQVISNFMTAVRPGPVEAVDEATGAGAQSMAVAVTRIPPAIPSPNDLAFNNLPSINLNTGELTFTTQPNSYGDAVFRVRLTDSGSNVPPNVNFSDQTFTITVNPINDPPTFTLGANVVVNEGATPVTRANWVTSIAAGPANESAQLPTLSFGTRVVSTSRTLAFDVPPAVASDGTLTFTPRAFTNGSAVVAVRLSDTGNGTAPHNNTSPEATFTITVNPVNDAPRLVNPIASFQVDEDAPTQVIELFPSVFADPDLNAFDQDRLSLRVLSNSNPGLVSTVLQNPVIDANTTTSNLRISFAANQHGSSVLVVDAMDLAGAAVQSTFTVTVNAINDAPVIGGATILDPSLFRPIEDAATALTGLVITDVDATENVGGRLNVSLVAARGSLLLRTDVAGGLVPADITANGTSSVNINATPAALNATLSAANGMMYRGQTNDNGPDQLVITVNDNGNSPAVPKSATATLNFQVAAVNDPPTTTNDAVTAAEDVVLSFASSILRANDSAGPANENGQTLSVTAVGTLPNTTGTVALQGGSVIYTPRADFVGTDVFTYQITDDGQTNGQSAPMNATGTVTVTITPVNDPPAPQADQQSATEDQQLVFDAAILTINDGRGSPDESGQILTVVSIGAASSQGGTVVLQSGAIQYTPAPNFFGTDTFTYVVQDNGTTNGSPDPRQATGTVTITVAPVNDDPITVADVRAGREGSSLSFAAAELAANDQPGPANESNQSLVVESVSAVSANGIRVTFANGTIIYNPPDGLNATFNGPDTFTYTVRDSGGFGGADRRSSIGTVTVNVAEVNNPPIGGVDQVATDEDVPLNLTAAALLANDNRGAANENSQTLVLTSVSAISAQGGSVTFSSNTNTVVYTPAANFNGTDTFTYVLTDNGTTAGSADPKSAVATVTVTVRSVNDAPLPLADAVSTPEDAPLSVAASVLLANDARGPANESSQNLTVLSVDATSQAGGTVTLVGGVITYVPPVNFNGVDTFGYTVRDDGTSNGNADPRTAVGQVNVTVLTVNDAPLPGTDQLLTGEDTLLDVAASSLVSNDAAGPANEVNQQLTVVGVSATSAKGGTVSLSNGQVMYTPPADFSGFDTFTYTVQDNGLSNGAADPKTAVGTVTVEVTAQNDPPIAVNDAYAQNEDARLLVSGVGILANDFDRDLPAQLLSVVNPAAITTSARGARLQVNADGTFTYDPTLAAELQALRVGQTVQDTFTYSVTDGIANSAPATVTVTVTGLNDAPVANHDQHSTEEDKTLTVTSQLGVLRNDSDPEGSSMSVTLVTTVSNGVLTLRPDGGFTYTPKPDFSGRDWFVYRASDGSALSEPATVVIDVTQKNDPPSAIADQYSVPRDGFLQVPVGTGVLANDTDGEGGPLTAQLVSTTSRGQLTLAANGSFTYRPNTGVSGTDTFTYRAVDSSNAASPTNATVTITITNNRPWQNPQNALDVNADGSVSAIDVLQIVNRLNAEGAHVLATPPDAPPPPYVDANGDGSVTPADALVVINFLNTRASGGEGEGMSIDFGSGLVTDTDGSVIVMPTTTAQAMSETSIASDDSEPADEVFAAWKSDIAVAAAAHAVDASWCADEAEDAEIDFLAELDQLFGSEGGDLLA